MFTSLESKREAWNLWFWCKRNYKWLLGIVLTGLVLSRMHVHLGYIDKDKQETAELIDQFHQRMNMEQYDQIYIDADPMFRNSLSR